jgi:antitoxin YefM
MQTESSVQSRGSSICCEEVGKGAKNKNWTGYLNRFNKELMSTITYSTARDHLAEVWDKTVSTREPVIVSRRGAESIVMLPLEEWEGLQETAHLLRSPANARRLLAALNRLDSGEGEILSIDSLARHSGIQ